MRTNILVVVSVISDRCDGSLVPAKIACRFLTHRETGNYYRRNYKNVLQISELMPYPETLRPLLFGSFVILYIPLR